MNLFHLFHRTKPGEHRISYIVKGDANDFNVTFKCGSDAVVTQEPHVHKGWKHTFSGHNGDYIFIAAQSNKPHSQVHVMLYEDGKLMQELTKAGDFPLVQLSGAV